MSAVRSTYTKGDFYTTGRVVPGVDNVVSQRDEVRHKAMRAKMVPGVGYSVNHDYLSDTDDLRSTQSQIMEGMASKPA
jgi:hypothetical protein